MNTCSVPSRDTLHRAPLALDSRRALAYHPGMNPSQLSRRAFVKVAGVAGVVSAAPSGRADSPTWAQGGAMPKHPVVHFEIGCRDLAATRDFYQKLFEWPIDDQFQLAEAGLAGHLTALGHDPQHYTMIYVQVDDAAAGIAKAVSLGARKSSDLSRSPPHFGLDYGYSGKRRRAP